MKIVSRYDAGKCLWEGECDCIREELVAAVKGGANLTGAYLTGANLTGADLHGADLRVMTPPMASHAFWSELLFRAADGDLHRRMVAGLVAVSTDWCWPRMLELMRGELADDWQQWAGAVCWQWPEECREVGLLEVVPDAPADGHPGETVTNCSSRDD